MNATTIMEAVNRYVPIYQDHGCVAADLGSPWLLIGEIAKVSPCQSIYKKSSQPSVLLWKSLQDCSIKGTL